MQYLKIFWSPGKVQSLCTQILYYFVISNNKSHWSLWISFFFPSRSIFQLHCRSPLLTSKYNGGGNAGTLGTQKELVKDASKNLKEIYSWIKIICMINIILTAYCQITPDPSSFWGSKNISAIHSVRCLAWKGFQTANSNLFCLDNFVNIPRLGVDGCE